MRRTMSRRGQRGRKCIVGVENVLLRLAQVIVKKLPSSPVRFGCRRGIVVCAGVAREGVIASRITIDLHIRLV
jgi:hypothetical protein